MNRESLAKMRLDRRLLLRRGWLKDAEREQALASLPDVGHKATTLGEALDDESDAGASERPLA
jgi:hypothetical protein